MLEISRPDVSSTGYQEFPIETRFFKLPVQNYISLLGIELCSPQYAIINSLNNPRYRFVTACVSRRVGKTYIANIALQLVSLMPGATVLIIAPDYNLASISWDLQHNLLEKFDIETTRDNAKDRIVELVNGSMIRVASVSRADSAVGRSYDFIVFDEAAINANGGVVFNVNLRPTLDKVNSKCLFISTPRGDNWFKEFYDRGFSDRDVHSNWVSIHADYKENPRASEEDILAARATSSHAEFEQEYLANFVTFEGQIYALKNDQIVDVSDVLDELASYRNRFDVIAGLDLGFRDDTAMPVILVKPREDGRLNFYIVDEYMQHHKDTASHAKYIGNLYEKYEIDYIYADPAAAQTIYDLASIYDIPSVKANKNKLEGIGMVASLIEHDQVFVSVNCVEVIYSLRNYKWKSGVEKETPEHDRASHMADAIRYAIYTYCLANL